MSELAYTLAVIWCSVIVYQLGMRALDLWDSTRRTDLVMRETHDKLRGEVEVQAVTIHRQGERLAEVEATVERLRAKHDAEGLAGRRAR